MGKLTVHTYENGQKRVEHVDMTPEMDAIMQKMRDWDGWCKCEKPETGEFVPRGHSVDVFCRNCGGCLQVG